MIAIGAITESNLFMLFSVFRGGHGEGLFEKVIKSRQRGIAYFLRNLQGGHGGGAQKLLGIGQLFFRDIIYKGDAGIFFKQNRKPGVGIGRGLGQFLQGQVKIGRGADIDQKVIKPHRIPEIKYRVLLQKDQHQPCDQQFGVGFILLLGKVLCL